jgi:hypothetical protein
MLKNLLFILGLVLLIAAGVVLYMNHERTTVATEDDTVDVEQISLNFLSQQAILREIRIESTFFADPRIRVLEDFRVTVPSEPAGRSNPFAPITAPLPQPLSVSTP